ncbi:hypothetical protein Pedsa_0887 [Pseudopedobacter saltans DSM 12145]|uniref:Uncharacterized protein n=1 Tax=Pseudopedobacter saltans (strain ATCC 51119 / DSM 12145 / JCM 21818 / CCUG 39354 / LMG 10337 / NBRC 100064 / NCIMB 13643) TaxID=762903 RepID=F0SA82_PSESL|nr:hypothetical protein [Pseudopedobacter saltans]ADY51459.1 hypothetical protein Pedsa_0887 [Pseudopedobacter saltans DSM 12145]
MSTEIEANPVHEENEPKPIVKPRNQHLKSADPKKYQFTGRATESEAETINRAIAARKKQLGLSENGGYDVVRLALDMIKHINNDIFSSFKVK